MEIEEWEKMDMDIEKKRLKNRKMLSTGLLIFISIIYFILKKIKLDESTNLFFSSLVAFAEASMVGALADWFAVVALFRHPLSMTWIPHTAIIKNSKEKVGLTISTFVVDNFFTQEKIMSVLQEIKISEKIKLYIQNNRDTIVNYMICIIPIVVNEISKNKRLRELIIKLLNENLDKLQLSNITGEALEKILKFNNNDIKLIKYVLTFTHDELNKNKDIVVNYIKQQRFLGFTIPNVIANSIYLNIYNLILYEIKSLDENEIQGISKIILDKLNEVPDNLKNSEETINKINSLKENFIKSDKYSKFVRETLWDIIKNNITDELIIYCERNPEKVSKSINEFIEKIYETILGSKEICEKIDNWAIKNYEYIISNNRSKIGLLISESIDQWNEEEMTEKIELIIGSDLQYIRINGTVVGGLVGVIIHLITHFII